MLYGVAGGGGGGGHNAFTEEANFAFKKHKCF